MALNLFTAAPLKPEIRLAQAISQFEACLSDGQKVAFRNQRTQSLKSPPSTKDVMRITAEIDISQKAGGCCFGPRFTKFLHGAQQFAALGDVLVGSSQNVIACGVWSVLRTSLLAITNRSSYIESLSLLLMEAGHSTRQHSDLALLYPRSKSLQTYITEYFIVVVQICLRFQLFAQKSAFGKFASSLIDADIKEAQSSLLAWSKSIQAEIGTLVAQKIETEAESNSRFRALMSTSSKIVSQQQKQIALRNILNCCSVHDYETTWRQIRKAGNTSLYAQMPEYNQRILPPVSATLILVGKLGYGKSVTLANIVDDLNLRIDPGVTGLAYFFCRHDLPESLVARTVIGAIIRQIISPLSHLFAESETVESYDFFRFFDLMCHVVPPNYAMYIVLDGLELCSPQERKTITEQLELMRKQFNIHICVSRRLEPDTELPSIATDFPNSNILRLPDNSLDIKAFIAARLEIALSDQSLALGDPAIILEIQDALLQGSQGMFLWVALQIQSLCTMQTDHEILEALVDLPRDLSQIYSRILQQAKRSGRSFQSDIFKLVIIARRPLTVHEMREALSVIPGDTVWDPSKLLNSVYPALATCGCLITVDEEELTIRTIHPSVNQFLLRDGWDLTNGVTFMEENARTLMSSTIVTYLSYGVFGTELAIRLPALNVGSAPSHIIDSTTGTNKGVQSMALKLLRSRKQPNFDASKALAQGFKRHIPSTVVDFHFQRYATTHIMEHLSELPVMPCAISDNLFRLFKQDTICVKTYKEMIGLLWLTLQPPGKADIIILLNHMSLEPALKLPLGVSIFRAMFYRAIETGRVHAIRYLLDLYRPIFLDYHAAVWEPKSVVFKVLRGICSNHFHSQAESPSRTEISGLFLGPAPLSHAIETFQERATDIFISDELIDINQGIGLDIWDKPIGLAMAQGDTRVLRTLLSADRLVLIPSEAQVLLNAAKKLNDHSIVSLLQDVIGAKHPKYLMN